MTKYAGRNIVYAVVVKITDAYKQMNYKKWGEKKGVWFARVIQSTLMPLF